MGCSPNTQENGHQGMAKHGGHKANVTFDGPLNFQSPCNMAAKKSGIQAKTWCKKVSQEGINLYMGGFIQLLRQWMWNKDKVC